MEYLKIKDNVDLKELEKFGFKCEDGTYYKDAYCMKNSKVDHEAFFVNIYVIPNRILNIGMYNDCEVRWTDAIDLVPIFDLIQAGLVEKVVE